MRCKLRLLSKFRAFKSCLQRRLWIMTKQTHWSVCRMLRGSYSIAFGLVTDCWAESSVWSAAYASSMPITNYTSTSSHHDLSSCIDGDAKHPVSYCAGCRWSWWYVYTTPIPLCLLLGCIPLETFPGHNPNQQKEHISPSRPVWMHKETAAVMGNLGCKSGNGDLIKCAWPLGWGGWMGHAPLSSHTASRLDFIAQTVCSQGQWQCRTKSLTHTTDQRDVDLIVGYSFYWYCLRLLEKNPASHILLTAVYVQYTAQTINPNPEKWG